jgi:hypothetical protein
MGLHHCSSRESRQGSLSATGLSCTVGVGHYRCAPFALAAVTPRRQQQRARESPPGAGAAAPGTKRTFQVAKAGKAESKRGVARQRVGLSSRRLFGGGLVHARSIHPRRLFFFVPVVSRSRKSGGVQKKKMEEWDRPTRQQQASVRVGWLRLCGGNERAHALGPADAPLKMTQRSDRSARASHAVAANGAAACLPLRPRPIG